MTADELTAAMLGELRREFYQAKPAKLFYQDRSLLLKAIAAPAVYLNDRGAKAPGSRYQSILRLVIRTIKAKGDIGAIHSFGRYFLHAVQEHMRHQGDRYYEEAKAPRPLSTLVPGAVRKLTPDQAATVTDALAQAHRALSVKSGRKKAGPPAAQHTLF